MNRELEQALLVLQDPETSLKSENAEWAAEVVFNAVDGSRTQCCYQETHALPNGQEATIRIKNSHVVDISLPGGGERSRVILKTGEGGITIKTKPSNP